MNPTERAERFAHDPRVHESTDEVVHVPIGDLKLQGNLGVPEGSAGSSCSPTAAAAAGTARATGSWPTCSEPAAWRPC